MKQKTIHLCSDDYSMDSNGNVLVQTLDPDYIHDDNDPWRTDYCWVKSKYRIGTRIILISTEDVSPNAIRSGRNTEQFYLKFNYLNGYPGNSNADICRYHGWRGTTNDTYIYAYGERKIIKIRELKNGNIAITVGIDLTADEE